MKYCNLLLYLSLFLYFESLNGQVKKSSKSEPNYRYKSFVPIDEKIITEHYHYIISQDKEGYYHKRVFYPETKQLTQDFIFLDKNMEKLSGLQREWLDNGNLLSEINYVKGKKEGISKTYSYDEGYLTETTYKNDELNGKVVVHKKGLGREEFSYINGKKEGEFIFYDSLGIVSNRGIYKSDTVYSQTLENDKKELIPASFICTVEQNEPNCGQKSLMNFFMLTTRYPAFARENDIQGKAICQFTINNDGSISDIVIHRGICEVIKKECIRILKEMPKWKPGTNGGKAVKSLFTVPINFKLE